MPWLHVRADGTFEVHLRDETYEGSYRWQGGRLKMWANYEADCELQRETLVCDNGAVTDTFVRLPGAPGGQQ